MPYRDPVHCALAEVATLHPQYSQDVRIMIYAKVSQMDERVRGIRHELPLNDEQWSQNVIVTRTHDCFEFLKEQATPWRDLQTNSPRIAQTMDNARQIVMNVYSGHVESVPIYMGGWIMICDVIVYLRSRLGEIVSWGTFLLMFEWALFEDFEMLFTPWDTYPATMVADPFVPARLPHHRAGDALIGRMGVEIHPAMFDIFPGVGVPIKFSSLRQVYVE